MLIIAFSSTVKFEEMDISVDWFWETINLVVFFFILNISHKEKGLFAEMSGDFKLQVHIVMNALE